MCSLQRGLFRPGWMYLSANHVCFSSKMLKDKIVIPFSQITTIEKHDTNVMFDAIMIKTRNGETVSLSDLNLFKKKFVCKMFCCHSFTITIK